MEAVSPNGTKLENPIFCNSLILSRQLFMLESGKKVNECLGRGRRDFFQLSHLHSVCILGCHKKWAHFSTKKLIYSPYSEWEKSQTAAPKGAWPAPQKGTCSSTSSLRQTGPDEHGKLEAPSSVQTTGVTSWGLRELAFESDGALAFLFPRYRCSG